MADNSGLLVGKKEIKAFLNDASDYQLKKWLEKGMPILIDDGGSNRGKTWTAHKKNLEDFFIKITSIRHIIGQRRKK